MLAGLRTRLTFANVVSVIALFVALGGTSVAALSLTRNSVKGKHIAPNAVTSSEVKDRSLLSEDFRPGELPQGDKGEKGDTGAAGAPGTPGTPGAPGSPAASMVIGNITDQLPANSGGANVSNVSPSGASGLSSSDLNRAQVSPNATIVVRDLMVTQSSVSGSGGTLTYRLEDVTTATAVLLLECSISSASVKSCNSGSQAATVAPGSRLVMEVRLTGTTSATFVGWGFRATTP